MMIYEMPEVSVGQIVLWYAQASPQVRPNAALITRIDEANGVRFGVQLIVFMPYGGSKSIDGVRHMNDPFLAARNPEITINGGWRHTPFTQRIHKLEEKLDKFILDTVSVDAGTAAKEQAELDAMDE